jgi:hypothetical protein
LTDAQWAKMEPHCLGKPNDPGRSGSNNRRFVEAVLWIARIGRPWPDLPAYFGKWNTVFKGYRDWVSLPFQGCECEVRTAGTVLHHEQGSSCSMLAFGSVVGRVGGRSALPGPAIVCRRLDLAQFELRPAVQTAAAPWIAVPLEVAQTVHRGANPVRLPQGQPAIFEGSDTEPSVSVAAERMRREAQSKLNMGATQACPVLDRGLTARRSRRLRSPAI